MTPLQSPSIELLAPALTAAQAEMSNASKSSVNDHLKSKYADLSSVREACLGPLTSNGLSVTQTFVPHTGEPVMFDQVEIKKEGYGRDMVYREFRVPVQMMGYLRTQLTHSSGQWIASELPVATVWGNPHLRGAAITYLSATACRPSPGSRPRMTTPRASRPACASRPVRKGNPIKTRSRNRGSLPRQPPPALRRGSPDPAPPSTEGLKAPAPAPAPAPVQASASQLPAELPKQPAKIKTGYQLFQYAESCTIDPCLKGWIIGFFPNRRSSPRRSPAGRRPRSPRPCRSSAPTSRRSWPTNRRSPRRRIVY